MAKKKKVQEKQEWSVYLTYEEDRSGGAICEGDEDSQWPSHENEYVEFEPKALFLYPTSFCETVCLDFDPSTEDTLHIVIVRYSTGSTFGRTLGCWHIEGAYVSYEEAESVAKAIEADKYKGTYKPWEGYFERLEGTDVYSMQLIHK